MKRLASRRADAAGNTCAGIRIPDRCFCFLKNKPRTFPTGVLLLLQCLRNLIRSRKLLLFSHPDFTVGTGIPSSEGHRFGRLRGSRTLPPVGTYTRPRRTLFIKDSIKQIFPYFKRFITKNGKLKTVNEVTVQPSSGVVGYIGRNTYRIHILQAIHLYQIPQNTVATSQFALLLLL